MTSLGIGQIIALLFSLASPSVALQVPHAQSAPPVTASDASAAGAVFTSLQGIWICTEDTIDPTGANIGDVWPFDLHGETLDPDGNWEYTTTFNHEPITSTGENTFTMQWGNSPTMSPTFHCEYLPDTDQIKFWSFTAYGGKPTDENSSKYYMFNRTEPHNDTECTDKELYYNMQYYSCENYKKHGECSWVTAISRGKQVDASQFCRKTCGRCTPDDNTTDDHSPTPTPPTPPPTQCDESTGTCTVYEDPHIEVFDKGQVSLMGKKGRHRIGYGAGDMWLVKSSHVSIQARYMERDASPDRSLFVRAIAIGGDFLAGHIMVIGSLEDQITWDMAPILENQTSEFRTMVEGFVVKADRSNHSSLVEDTATENPGVNIELPLGVSLIVNRLHHYINTMVKMISQKGGQDGLCGNFNGFSADDSLEMSSARFDPRVTEKESLFAGISFES